MKQKLSILILMLILTFWPSYAQSELEQADSAFRAGDYLQAATRYEAIANGLNQPSSELLYNLGLSYLQLNDNAHAMLYFLRSQQITPNDTDIQANIARIRAGLGVSVDVTGDLFSQWISTLRSFTSQQTLLGISWLLWICGWSVFALAIMKRLKNSRRLLTGIGVALLLTLAAWASDRIYDTQRPQAVIMVETSAKSGPAEDYLELFMAQAGLEVRQTAEQGNWVRVITIDGRSAWIRARDITRVKD